MKYAFPDIHGRLDLLLRAWEMVQPTPEDKVIFMGDMIDRGPDSKGVVEFIMDKQQKNPDQVIVLVGNHEQFLLDAVLHGLFDGWLYPGNGGIQTLKSYGVPLTNYRSAHTYITPEVVKWIGSLPTYYEDEEFFFSHAPIEKGMVPPFTRDQLTWTYFQHEEGKSYHHPGKTGVCGHIHRLQYGEYAPRYYDHYLFLDAGCGCSEKAPLVVTEVTQRKPIWVWPGPPIGPKKRKFIPPEAA